MAGRIIFSFFLFSQQKVGRIIFSFFRLSANGWPNHNAFQSKFSKKNHPLKFQRIKASRFTELTNKQTNTKHNDLHPIVL